MSSKEMCTLAVAAIKDPRDSPRLSMSKFDRCQSLSEASYTFLRVYQTQQVAPVRICLCSPILFIWLKWLVCLFFVFNGQITLLYVSASVFLCS